MNRMLQGLNPLRDITRLPATGLPWMLALAMVVSWLDFDPFGLPFRTGLVWSALVVGLAVIMFWQQEGLRLLARLTIVEAAALSVAVSALLSAISSGAAFLSIAEAIRIGAVLLFFCLVRLCPDTRALRTALGAGAVLVVIINFCILLFALTFRTGPGAFLFEVQFQEVLGTLPRFKGFAAHPMAFGGPFLPLVAMAAWPCSGSGLFNRRLSLTAAVIAALVLGATLSFAAVSLVIVLAGVCMCGKRLRPAGTLLAAISCLLLLWCDPVSVSWAGRDWYSNPPPPQYSVDGLGPQYMPMHELKAGQLQISFRFRGYFYLLTGSADCASDSLLLGNGPKRFESACDITTMGTGGGWSSNRSAHTEYGALLAERGLLGVFTTLCLVAALLRQHIRNAPHENSLLNRLDTGVILAYLVAAFAGPIWYQMGFAALVGMWSRGLR